MSEYVGLKQGKVHESHVISEYYCGGCGWPVTDHDSYCPECGGELHEGMGKSRWAAMFGTPERAARTLQAACEKVTFCGECPMFWECSKGGIRNFGEYDAFLEWLSGDTQ